MQQAVPCSLCAASLRAATCTASKWLVGTLAGFITSMQPVTRQAVRLVLVLVLVLALAVVLLLAVLLLVLAVLLLVLLLVLVLLVLVLATEATVGAAVPWGCCRCRMWTPTQLKMLVEAVICQRWHYGRIRISRMWMIRGTVRNSPKVREAHNIILTHLASGVVEQKTTNQPRYPKRHHQANLGGR